MEVVVANRKVRSVTVTDLRLSTCRELTPATPLLNTWIDGRSTGPLGPRTTTLTSSTIAAALRGGAPDGTVSLDGGYLSDREIRGVATVRTADGNCRGSVAFTARR